MILEKNQELARSGGAAVDSPLCELGKEFNFSFRDGSRTSLLGRLPTSESNLSWELGPTQTRRS